MEATIIKDIGLYKNRLVNLLLQSPDICEALLGLGYTEEDVFGDENDDDDYGIVYRQVFPYLYIDETQTTVLPYLCLEVDIPRVPTRTIKDMKIIIWCYCHRDCMKYSKKGYLGTRADILSDMVERQLRSSEKFGIGLLQLDSVTYLSNTNSNYYGRQMIFTISDFTIKR